MKKVILMVIIFSKAIIADGTMTITGNILPSATVGFETITENLIDDKRFFKGADIDVGVFSLGEVIPPVTKDIFVKTNIPTGVNMKIINQKNYLKSYLTDASDNNLKMKYKLMGVNYDMTNPTTRALCNSIKDGSISVGTFVVEQYQTTSADQTPSTYSATFNVEITAN